jgi:hypothetical protein
MFILVQKDEKNKVLEKKIIVCVFEKRIWLCKK